MLRAAFLRWTTADFFFLMLDVSGFFVMAQHIGYTSTAKRLFYLKITSSIQPGDGWRHYRFLENTSLPILTVSLRSLDVFTLVTSMNGAELLKRR